MELTRLDGLAQRLPRREQMFLADEFIEGARPHAIRERPQIRGSAGRDRSHAGYFF
jgi:hypothetical protein